MVRPTNQITATAKQIQDYVDYLNSLNSPAHQPATYRSRELSNAITYLETGMLWAERAAAVTDKRLDEQYSAES